MAQSASSNKLSNAITTNKKTFLISSIVFIGSLLTACDDPTQEMEFKASIQRLGNGELALISEVSNFSKTPKTLNDIDIDDKLHKSLRLSTVEGTTGEYIPFDNTISYSINRQLDPGESFLFRLIGQETNQFVSGDVDFIVDSHWDYRSVSVGCCR